jgi:hypothetical protein
MEHLDFRVLSDESRADQPHSASAENGRKTARPMLAELLQSRSAKGNPNRGKNHEYYRVHDRNTAES